MRIVDLDYPPCPTKQMRPFSRLEMPPPAPIQYGEHVSWRTKIQLGGHRLRASIVSDWEYIGGAISRLVIYFLPPLGTN